MKSKDVKKWILILVIIPFLFTCEKDNKPVSYSSPVIIDYPEFQFKLYAGVSESESIVIYDSLIANEERIKNHLGVSNMPELIVSVWSD